VKDVMARIDAPELIDPINAQQASTGTDKVLLTVPHRLRVINFFSSSTDLTLNECSSRDQNVKANSAG
jgi:hypothetical protein